MKKLITASMYLVIGTLVSGVAMATSGPNPQTVPDAASTSALLGMTLAGLTVVRRYISK